jgi:hypothetical protein
MKPNPKGFSKSFLTASPSVTCNSRRFKSAHIQHPTIDFCRRMRNCIRAKGMAEYEKIAVNDPRFPDVKNYSRTVGDHVRRRIERSNKQMQYGAKQGVPSVLLIYNNLDPILQMWGTEHLDFITATYGELTILLNKETKQRSELFWQKPNATKEKEYVLQRSRALMRPRRTDDSYIIRKYIFNGQDTL